MVLLWSKHMIVKLLQFIFCLFCCSGICYASDVITDNAGEKSMIINLRNAIDNDMELKALKDQIIIGAGVSGADAFSHPSTSKKLRILLTWQWIDSFKNLTQGTVIVVPEHAVDERFRSLEKMNQVKLLTISGVLHNKTLEKLKDESIEWIHKSTNYIVVLAGDTQQENGKWTLYNRNMLEDFLKDLPKDKNILILNGPRTGKHLENTETVDESAHRTSIDYITLAAIEKKVPTWQIVDFKYGAKSNLDSAMNFCIKNPNVALILPGESTSMISEALSLGIMPVIYEHPSMTDTSRKYIAELKSKGLILLYPHFERDQYIQTPLANQTTKILKAIPELLSNLSN